MKLSKKILQALAWLVLIIGLIAAGCAFGQSIEFRPALTAQAPAWGVGRAEAHIGGYLSPVCREEGYHSIAEYTEGDGEPPEWYRPGEEMAVEWVAAEPHPPAGISPNGIDWNICSTLYGADGLKMEQWEMGLFARILYREFWGTSRECCEAGADSIINLWASEYYGNSLFDTLSAVTETGEYAFSTFPGVWEEDYDPDGLAEMQSICEDRFYNGTEYEAAFFRTDHYHGEWAVPCFCFTEDNVYFSTGKGWQ